MSVIQKIRNKYAKIAGFVIALSLVGFILMDATSSGRFRDLFGRDESVAKVNGEKIDQREYSQKVKDFEILYAYSYAQQGRTVDEGTKSQINQQALSDLINYKLVSAECEKLGLTTTKEEEKDLIYGANPDQLVKQYQYFQNPDTKSFDPQRVKAFEQQADQIDPTGKLKEQWETLKSFILQNAKLRKYNALLSKAGTMPSFIFDRKNTEKQQVASIRFLKVRYNIIDNKLAPVTEDEMVEYMKAHKKQYTQDQEGRSIEYVSFDILPSAADTAKALGSLQQLKAEFASTIDVESIVNRNSDEQYNPSFVNKKSFASAYVDSIFGLPVGAVYGPYFENGSYKMTKVVDKKMMPDSVKCRHILVRTENNRQAVRSDSAAQKTIDSAIAITKSGAFGEAVQKYSEDDGSKSTGGEYTFTLQQKGQLSKEFADFIFDGKPGEKKTVKVSNDNYAGYHYIEILEHKGIQTSEKLATISKALEAGEETTNGIYAKAAEFAGKNNTTQAFDAAIKKDGINKKIAENIKENDFNVQGLGNSREVVRWMYESKEGDVSSIFALQGKYVIAKLSSIQKEGLVKLDATNRPQIEELTRNEKKAKIIIDKYKSVTSFDQLVTTSGQTAGQADSFDAASQFINRLGYEPKAVGYIFSKESKIGTLSPAFKSQDGVLYFSIINKFTKQSTETPEQLKQEKIMMSSQSRGALSGAIGSLTKAAKIKYNAKNL